MKMVGVPQEVVAALEKMRRDSNGTIAPEKVVEEARDDNSPLHVYFEWDDDKAAQAHRLEQARGLLRRVRIIYHEPETPTVVRIAAYVSPPASRRHDDGGYRLASEMVREYASADVLYEIAATIETLTKKLRGLGEVFDLRDDVESLERAALSLRVRAQREGKQDKPKPRRRPAGRRGGDDRPAAIA
jgi:hypothetical protein